MPELKRSFATNSAWEGIEIAPDAFHRVERGCRPGSLNCVRFAQDISQTPYTLFLQFRSVFA
jgi:hypothetical protein